LDVSPNSMMQLTGSDAAVPGGNVTSVMSGPGCPSWLRRPARLE
jgi:hypothetical protein